MSRFSDSEAVNIAAIEGAGVSFEHHRKDFMSAAADCIQRTEQRIIRDFPEFYSKQEVIAAGGSLWKRRLHGRFR